MQVGRLYEQAGGNVRGLVVGAARQGRDLQRGP